MVSNRFNRLMDAEFDCKVFGNLLHREPTNDNLKQYKRMIKRRDEILSELSI